MEVNFHKCTDTLVERFYDRHTGSFLLKLNSGDIVVADLNWRQGRFNNYYFRSEYFDIEVPLSDVKEIAIIQEEENV